MIKNMLGELKFWFRFFKSENFGFRFKIANLIMNDELRGRLAIDLITLENIGTMISGYDMTRTVGNKINIVYDDIYDIMSK